MLTWTKYQNPLAPLWWFWQIATHLMEMGENRQKWPAGREGVRHKLTVTACASILQKMCTVVVRGVSFFRYFQKLVFLALVFLWQNYRIDVLFQNLKICFSCLGMYFVSNFQILVSFFNVVIVVFCCSVVWVGFRDKFEIVFCCCFIWMLFFQRRWCKMPPTKIFAKCPLPHKKKNRTH